MSDLGETKLRSLAAALVEESPEPPAFDRLPLAQPVPNRRPRKGRALVAAGMVLALAIGAVALARGLDSAGRDRTPPNTAATRKAYVGESTKVGPLTVLVEHATSTVSPHTYVLTMSITNRGAKPTPFPAFELGCKAPLGPRGFGITGFVISGRKLDPRETESGEVTLYPQQICENPTVTISRHVVKGPHDQVTYVLRGLI
jgi:hypothetical protein